MASIVAALLFGYLVGSIPVALMVAERHGVHIRSVGDHNPGFWNTNVQLGLRNALPVLVGDVAKGTIASAVGVLLEPSGDRWLPVVATAAAMVGHAWPILAEFRGGRGALTLFGGAIVFAPLATVVAGAVIVATGAVTTFAAHRLANRYQWAIGAGLVALPVAQLVEGHPLRALASGALGLFVVFRVTLCRRSDEPVAARATTGSAMP